MTLAALWHEERKLVLQRHTAVGTLVRACADVLVGENAPRRGGRMFALCDTAGEVTQRRHGWVIVAIDDGSLWTSSPTKDRSSMQKPKEQTCEACHLSSLASWSYLQVLRRFWLNGIVASLGTVPLASSQVKSSQLDLT